MLRARSHPPPQTAARSAQSRAVDACGGRSWKDEQSRRQAAARSDPAMVGKARRAFRNFIVGHRMRGNARRAIATQVEEHATEPEPKNVVCVVRHFPAHLGTATCSRILPM